MHGNDSQFKKHKRKHKRLVYGGVVLPIVPGYYMWTDPTYGYGGGYMNTATNTGGGQDSGSGEGLSDAGGAIGQ